MATAELSTSVVQLDWSMKDGLVTVTPKDQARFCVKVSKAIEILQQAGRADTFTRQFNLLVQRLAEWIQGRNDVRASLSNTSRWGPCLRRGATSCAYDDEFEDALSALDFQIANDLDLDLVKMDAIGLPLASVEAVRSFLDQGFTLEYIGHGDRSESHCAGQ